MGKKKNKRRPKANNDASSREQQVDESHNNDSDDSSGGGGQPVMIERPIYVSDQDDLAAAVIWMSQGRVDTKGFAKYLPHTTKMLQEQKVSPEEVSREMEEIYSQSACLLPASKEIHQFTAMAQICVQQALPATMFQSESQKDDISASFHHDLELLISEQGLNKSVADYLKDMKDCVDQICEKWAPRLDRELFDGKEGTFLSKCPLYGIPPERYNDDNMPMSLYLDDERERVAQATIRRETFLSAAKMVVTGFHNVSSTCWECQRISKDLKNCARCKAAQYCSKECQRSAWAKGHKQKCKLLGCKYAALEAGLKVMDEYHSPAT